VGSGRGVAGSGRGVAGSGRGVAGSVGLAPEQRRHRLIDERLDGRAVETRSIEINGGRHFNPITDAPGGQNDGVISQSIADGAHRLAHVTCNVSNDFHL
jgi:hypothetical protein